MKNFFIIRDGNEIDLKEKKKRFLFSKMNCNQWNRKKNIYINFASFISLLFNMNEILTIYI